MFHSKHYIWRYHLKIQRCVKSDWLQDTLGRSVKCWLVLWTDVRRDAIVGLRWHEVKVRHFLHYRALSFMHSNLNDLTDLKPNKVYVIMKYFILYLYIYIRFQMKLLSKCMCSNSIFYINIILLSALQSEYKVQ